MTSRLIIPALFLASCLSSSTLAQNTSPHSLALLLPPPIVPAHDFNPDKTVLAMTDLKIYGPAVTVKYGTGFCLDPACRFIGTNYHVAAPARIHKIKGKEIINRYLATGPNDVGATVNKSAALLMGSEKYTLSRDLAVYELRYPVEGYHGIAYDLAELQAGDEVDIYAFPKAAINPIRHLSKFHATYFAETTDGMLVFRYGGGIRPGASGGIVVKNGKIVGILNAIGLENSTLAFAVKVQSLATFLSKVQPYLHAQLFPEDTPISPVSTDLYPPYAFPPTTGTGRRPVEPPEVVALRQKAQAVSDGMRNFIAVQSFSWGVNNKVPQREAQYEVRVIDGFQRFREYPDGKKEFRDVPLPTLNDVMAPGGEWSELPEMVGTRLNLKVHQAADATVNGRRVKVFQYKADPEDDICKFKSILDFEIFSVSKIHTVSCYGEVWTDEDFNIIRMSEHLNLFGTWKNYQAVVTFDWLQKESEPKKLIPITIASQAEYHNRTYWCLGLFTGYRVFDSRVKILTN
jgi:hypothetical protein